MSKENYNFGEKNKEIMNGVECPVWQTPKYLEAKEKVIETLESEKYRGILKPSDFWILMNTYSNKTKVMYSGLIISHNGCLKINDILEKPFNPKALTLDKEGYNGSLVYTYCDDDIFEVGEVNIKNCKNEYPYAMALKRCFDRVVLKKCKLAYAGVYSDSEAEEFKQSPNETQKETYTGNTTKPTKNPTKETPRRNDSVNYRELLIKKIEELNLDINAFASAKGLNGKSTQDDFEKAYRDLVNSEMELGFDE